VQRSPMGKVDKAATRRDFIKLFQG
jgi:hypothetical protein